MTDVAAISAHALRLMLARGIDPTPRHYAVWYRYAEGLSQPLQTEIDRLIAEDLPFDDAVGDYLHDKYLNDKNEREDASHPRAMLADILRLIASLSSETELYNQQLDERISEMQGHNTIGDMRDVIGAIVDSANKMKRSSADLQESLHESRAEIEQLRKNLHDATLEAERDFLTGLFNRKAFDRMLDQLLGFAVERRAPLSLLMVDIDHFKTFNDTHGHLIGDEVLKMVARLVKDTVKGTDVVTRFGGEEFAVILPSTPIGGALVVAENIRRAIAGKELRHKESGSTYGSVTVSIGAAEHRQADTIPLLVRRADAALYDSKKAGRNRVTVAEAA